MMSTVFCSVCLSPSPCEGDVIMKLWGACATLGTPTDRAGPTPWPLPLPVASGPLSPEEALTMSVNEVSLSDAENERKN